MPSRALGPHHHTLWWGCQPLPLKAISGRHRCHVLSALDIIQTSLCCKSPPLSTHSQNPCSFVSLPKSFWNQSAKLFAQLVVFSARWSYQGPASLLRRFELGDGLPRSAAASCSRPSRVSHWVTMHEWIHTVVPLHGCTPRPCQLQKFITGASNNMHGFTGRLQSSRGRPG